MNLKHLRAVTAALIAAVAEGSRPPRQRRRSERKFTRLSPRPSWPVPGDLVVHGWSVREEDTVSTHGPAADEPVKTTWVNGRMADTGVWSPYRRP